MTDRADRQPTAPLPRVLVLALGGTIAMTRSGDGLNPTRTAADLLAAVPSLDATARIEAVQVMAAASAELSLTDIAALAARIETALADGVEGVVVVQGTDSLEDTAFALDVLLDRGAAVVVTGAMRGADAPGADGPANLAAAVRVAASPDAQGLGVVVVMNDEIHAARYVQKRHTSNVGAFQSPGVGLLGRLSEGRVRVMLKPAGRGVRLAWGGSAPLVAVVPAAAGADPAVIGAARSLGPAGVVVAALGAGHVPSSWAGPLTALAQEMPVVLASQTGAGDVFTRTYGYPGGEIDLLARGLVPAGALTPGKARVLLSLLLGAGASHAEIATAFDAW